MRITSTSSHDEYAEIAETCANVLELDLSSNLFEDVSEVLEICSMLPKLRSLTLDGNRLRLSRPLSLHSLRELSLSNMLFESWSDYTTAVSQCPDLRSLAVVHNALTHVDMALDPSIKELDLSGNDFTALAQLQALASMPSITKIVLKHNRISSVPNFHARGSDLILTPNLFDLDLAYNQISTWSFFDNLPTCVPGLKHLRVTGNPLYQSLTSVDGKQLSSADGYMLTIARLPSLETLNYSKITDKERLNAETYYLSQIATELALSPAETAPEILHKHPRWKDLVEEYGEPAIIRKPDADKINPNSLAARLLLCQFHLPPDTLLTVTERHWQDKIPKSFDIYVILGIVGKRLGVMPLRLRLVWETGERDPIARPEGQEGPEWWDSDDEEVDDTGGSGGESDGETVAREVELVAGTRALGTYVEAGRAVFRIEVRDRLGP